MAIPRSKSPSSAPAATADTNAAPGNAATAVTKTDKPAISPAVLPADVAGAAPSAVTVASPDPAPATLPRQPQPAVAVPSVPVAASVADDDLPSILRRLTPIQRAKLRSAAISEGLLTSASGRDNPDGSLSVMIRVDADLVPQLKTWAEEAGTTVENQVRDIVGMLLSSYLMSPWEPPQPVGATAAPVAAAAAAAPASAAVSEPAAK